MTISEIRPDPDALRRNELSSFLRSRRERVTPQQVGLISSGRRRTPGLRREEVAQLAGVGVTWYTWLEQGRDIRASEQVLEAIARTLRLDRDERYHLFRLAGQFAVETDCELYEVPASVSALLRQLEPFPACLQNAKYDLIAYNRTYGHLVDDLDALEASDRNCMWLTFTDPQWRRSMVDWEAATARMVAQFRGQLAEHVGEPAWKAQIKRLKAASPEFARLWQQHEIAAPQSSPRKRFQNQWVGPLQFDVVPTWLAPRSGVRMLVYTPADAQTRQGLESLAALAGSGTLASVG